MKNRNLLITAAAIFAFLTILSSVLIAHSMYLYFRAFDITNTFEVELSNIAINDVAGSLYVSIDVTVRVYNPTEWELKYTSIWVKLYLNNRDNFLGESHYYIELFRAPKMPPYSNITKTIRISNVHRMSIPSGPNLWIAKITVWVYGIPLLEGGAGFERIRTYVG